MTLVGTAARRYRFGRFLLDPDRRLLSADGVPVSVGSRAYDILQLLIERRDVVVSREDILACVWRGTMVEGNTLAVQISALRRALGETQVIATVPGRGYRFVGSVSDEAVETPHAPDDVETDRRVVAAAFAVPDLPGVVAEGRWPRMRWFGFGAAAVLVLVAVAGIRLRHAWQTPIAPRLSIVVLPFRNLGGDVQQEYLADAISDDLTTDLSHIPGSLVIARASADTYKGRMATADTIGRALNVRYLLEGSLRAEGDKLHINAQLIDAPTGMHLWADAFDTPRNQLDTARSEIVRHIASVLNVTLVDIEGARSLHDRPENPDAIDYFLRARSVLDHSYSMSSLLQAQGLLEHAVSADVNYTEALAMLGVVLLHKISDFDDPTDPIDHENSRLLINRSIDLSPQNVSSISAKGELALVEGKCDQAEASFKLALSISPDSLIARRGLARCARKLGKMAEMIDVLQETIRIEPSGPQNAADQHFIGMGKLFMGEAAQAIQWLDSAGAEITDANRKDMALGWQEWRLIYLVAATQLTGASARAKSMYIDYDREWPGRTVRQLASYDTHAVASLPTYPLYLAALRSAGMPDHTDEQQDFHVSPRSVARSSGDFDPTPLTIPGGKRIDTSTLSLMIKSELKPLILDFGRGAAVIPSAHWLRTDNSFEDQNKWIDRMLTRKVVADGRPVVLMSDGPLGWASYNAALYTIAKPTSNVFWYRGGEEAWLATGLPSADQRIP